MKRIILLNILFLLLLMGIFIIAAFSMGYVADKRFGTDAGILFVLIITLHLFLNYLIMHKQKDIRTKHILYSSAAIVCIYLLILFH